MRKITTGLLERRDKQGELVNGGMHSQKAYRRVVAMLDGHGFTSPRLYHLLLIDMVDGPANPKRFQAALKALCRELSGHNIRYRWRAALELDDEKDGKGWHLHVFMLLENRIANANGILTSNRNMTKPPEQRNDRWPARIKQPDGTKGKVVRTLADIMDSHPLEFHIAKPQNRIHNGHAYASLAGDEKKADCREWLSYLVKARSKPDDIRGIYFSSRDSRQAQLN